MNKEYIIDELTREQMTLEKILKDTENRLSKAPEGKVHTIKHGKSYQYYLRQNPSDKNGAYISAKDHELAARLIQKAYDQKVVFAVKKQLSLIRRFVRDYNPNVLKDLYSSLTEARRINISPVEVSDQKYIEEWLSYQYPRKEFAEDAPEHFTHLGERVRSKSEVMIADALEQIGIPYRYECPADIGGNIIYPDFTILRISDRQEIYWEHLGMMDDPDYCYNAVQRIRLYEKNEVMPWKNLILTMETSRQPINYTIIKLMIMNYCM